MNLEGLTKKVTSGRWKTVYFENDEGDIVAKVCRKCSQTKLLDGYAKGRGKGSRDSACKQCKLTYYGENKERYIENNRIWVEQNREKTAEYYRKWNGKNKERRAEISRNWHKENKDHRTELARKWRLNNPEKSLLLAHRRRARKKSLPDTLTSEEYKVTLEYFENSCALTGKSEGIEKEHAIPLSIGHGGTTFGNCYPMVYYLNYSKGTHNIFEWFEANNKRFNIEQERFDRLIEWLGKANEMTVEEYRAYVYECHANPNEINDAEAN